MHHEIMQEASEFLVQTFRLQVSFYELSELCTSSLDNMSFHFHFILEILSFQYISEARSSKSSDSSVVLPLTKEICNRKRPLHKTSTKQNAWFYSSVSAHMSIIEYTTLS